MLLNTLQLTRKIKAARIAHRVRPPNAIKPTIKGEVCDSPPTNDSPPTSDSIWST